MRLNIITPCSRPQNLDRMFVDIPDWARWLVCYDGEGKDSGDVLCHVDPMSISGNAQRNYCIDRLTGSDYVHFLDDDTIFHQGLIDILEEAKADMVVFQQVWPNGKLRVPATMAPRVRRVDSGNFIVRADVIGQVRWRLDAYEADGYFVEDLLSQGLTVQVIDKAGSYYNYLR